MTLKTQLILSSALLVAGLVGGFALSWQHHSAQVVKAEQDAQTAKEQALQARALAEQKDRDAQAQKARADAAEKIADTSEAIFRAKAGKHPTLLPPLPAPPPDCAPFVERIQVLETQIADKDQTIEAGKVALDDKNKAIGELKIQIADLVTSRDLWKKSADEERKRAACLEVALEAQKALTKQALWKGRLQGLAIGIGGGYLAGRH